MDVPNCLEGHIHPQTTVKQSYLLKLIICIALVSGTLAIYAPVRHFEFLNYDDKDYITDNPHVLGGLSRANIGWAFTRFHASNWHPLTWLSHMLDVEWSGKNSGAHHLTNVLIHCANAVLLFLTLSVMTGVLWRSAFVAVIFAWHPLHVESVAWIAERKDVLSTFFWMLTMVAYFSYTRRLRANSYFLVLLLFACGLMSKSMLVTLPFALLLLDYWPLQRAGLSRHDIRKWISLVVEKVPLLVLSVISSALTFSTQHRAGSMKSVLDLPWQFRLSNACVSYITYIWKSVWPAKLAVFYPLPSAIPLWSTAGAAVLLLAVTVTALVAAKRYPFLMVGWFWYLGTLVPVIGLVQVGNQSMADRYTYVPLIGLTIAAAWGVWEILRTNARAQVIAAVLFIACALLCLQATARQLRYWQSSISLFEHALAVTSDNWIAHSNLSHALLNKNDDAEAAAYHADKAVRIRPTDPAPHVNLGIALLRLKRTSEARGEFETALRIEPNWPDAHQDLGGALMLDGKVDEAIPHFYTALRYDPDHLPSLKALGWIRSTRSDARWRNADEALRCAKRAVELTNRKDAEALDVLAAALAEAGRFSEAIATDEEARTLALIGKQAALANEITERLELYHLGLPYRTHP